MIEGILWVLFVLGCILASVVILLQEGRGGGFTDAFGGVGQQTFGVRAEGITKFTGYVMVGVVLLAILITKMRSTDSAIPLVGSEPLPPPGTTAPVEPPATPPADPDPEDQGN